MSNRDQLPSVEDKKDYGGSSAEVHRHPAYGLVRMTTPTGGKGVLFGSDVRHNQCVSIEVHRAELHRSLSHDWHHDNEMLLKIEMSHAQFAQFITSNGNGVGTPCTLRYAPEPGYKIEQVPGIQQIETKGQTFRREIQNSAREQVEKIQEEVNRLGEMLASGKTPKAELKDIHRTLGILLGNLPSNLGYVVSSAETAIDTLVSHAKIEVEAYSDGVARRLGLENIRHIGLLEAPTRPESE